MESLIKYVYPDAHICAFSENETIISNRNSIVFVDNPISYKGLYHGLYKRFAGKHAKLIAYGRPQELESIYNDFDCSGIGELKLYKWVDGDVEGDIKELTENLPTIKKIGCPVWFHCDIDGPIDRVAKIIQNLPNKFVWCHAGVGENCEDISGTLAKAVEYQAKLPNLWIEISWLVLDYLVLRPDLLNRFDKGRLLIGTDNNPISNNPENVQIVINLQKFTNYNHTKLYQDLFCDVK